MVIVALYTGMRRGEIYNLQWEDIDLQRGIIYVLDTKNSEAREVRMADIVRRALVSIKRHPESSYVFCKKDGTKYGSLKKSFLKALDKSGIMNFRFHDLRHTFASHLVMNNIDLNTVRELLGHKSLRMTLRYAHLSRDHKRVAIEHFDEAMDTKP